MMKDSSTGSHFCFMCNSAWRSEECVAGCGEAGSCPQCDITQHTNPGRLSEAYQRAIAEGRWYYVDNDDFTAFVKNARKGDYGSPT